jgi:hypothetical protein
MRRIVMAVAVLALLAGCQATAPRSATSTTPDAVPWLDQPPPAPPTTTAPPPAPDCTAADLPATAGHEPTGGVSQSQSAVITVHNVGGSRCTLAGSPTLLAIAGAAAGGRAQPVPTTPWRNAPTGQPAILAPGESAGALVIFSYACTAGDPKTMRTYRGFVIVVAGRQIPVPGLSLSGSCQTLSLDTWRTTTPVDQPPVPRRFGEITAGLTTPATVHRGATFDFAVTLTNTSSVAVSLDPCPGYREEFYKHMESYQLNCAPGTIPAGGSVRFAMRIGSVSFTPPGPTTLTWALIEPAGDSAVASTTITVTA